MRILIIFFILGICLHSKAQQTIAVLVTGGEDKTPLIASILLQGSTAGYSTDSLGRASLTFLSNGANTISISAVGFAEKKINISIPLAVDTLEINLESTEEEMEEVIVQSTRTSRTIANVPTRIETIEMEEIDEKSNMRPANVAMILHESTGIQVQQTSATSGNASIRIQGLDGRYTQLLKDGFPNFGNFSSGLSVLEIPPLDLKQVEIIKGPASPLFGGGAIAGVVNFISRTPNFKPAYNMILNQSNIGQTNIGGFASARGKKVGYTMLALYNRQLPYDVDNDDFTEVPKSNEFTLHPKLFIYPNEHTTIILGNSFTKGERIGGDIQVINGKPDPSHQYFETNKTTRNISTFEYDQKISDQKRIIVKQSLSVFDRTIDIPAYNFSGIDLASFTDIAYVQSANKHALVLGGNFIYNDFDETSNSNGNRDNTSATGGIYGQHTWDASEKVKLETGLRVEMANYRNAIYSTSETFVLPRVSLLLKYSPKWSSRIGGGMGYKMPTLFTEKTETIQYQNVAPLDNVHAEKSYGATADVNFRTNLSEDLSFSLNHMFFLTTIQRPLVLETDGLGVHHFVNAGEPVRSMGFETNVKLIFKEHFKVFLGYTFTDATAKYLPGNSFLPLVPKSKLNSALIYEKEGVIKLGLEGYFTGKQYLSNGSQTPAFSEFGFMAEKIFKTFSIYINFENFTDTRQSRYKNVVNGSHLDPTFDEIWTHTEGFVFNGGIKLKF